MRKKQQILQQQQHFNSDLHFKSNVKQLKTNYFTPTKFPIVIYNTKSEVAVRELLKYNYFTPTSFQTCNFHLNFDVVLII
jgi:hypothetical protein